MPKIILTLIGVVFVLLICILAVSCIANLGQVAVIKSDWMIMYRLESYKPLMVYYFKPVSSKRVLAEEFKNRQCYEVYYEMLVKDGEKNKKKVLVDGKDFSDGNGWTTICLTKEEVAAGIKVDSVGVYGVVSYPGTGAIESGAVVDFNLGGFRLVDDKTVERGEVASLSGYDPRAVPARNAAPVDPAAYANCQLRILSGEDEPNRNGRFIITGPCTEYNWVRSEGVRKSPLNPKSFGYVVYANGFGLAVTEVTKALGDYRTSLGFGNFPIPILK